MQKITQRITLDNFQNKLLDLRKTFISLGITAKNNVNVDSTNLATIAASLYFGRDNMQARRFLSVAWEKYPDECKKIIKEELAKFLKGERNKEQTFSLIAERILGIVRTEINTNKIRPELKPATLKARKNRHKKNKNYTPFVLKDTGQLVQALDYELEK